MFVLLLAAQFLTDQSAQAATQNGAAKLMIEQKMLDSAKAALKLRVKATEIEFDHLSADAPVVCGQFNARYNFSMFAGDEPFIFNSDSGKIMLPTDSDFSTTWNNVCSDTRRN